MKTMFQKRFIPVSLALLAAFALVFVAGRYSPRADASALVKAANSFNAESVNPATTFQSARSNGDVGAMYFSLAMTPKAARHGLYSQLDAKQKKAVWFLHLTLVRLSADGLTREQEAIFQDVGVALYGLNYDDLSANEANVAKFRALTDRAEAAFGKATARLIFSGLGEAVSLNPAQPYSFQKASAVFADCACNDYWNFCGSGKVCKKQDSSVCTTTSSGCGFLWAYPCNGECRDEVPE